MLCSVLTVTASDLRHSREGEGVVEEIPVEKQAEVSFVAQKNSAFRAGSPAEPLPGAVRPRNAKFLQKS
jgi:hypothetical protein